MRVAQLDDSKNSGKKGITMAIKTNYKFEKMERDRLKAEKKKRRMEEKRMNQSKDKNCFEAERAQEKEE